MLAGLCVYQGITLAGAEPASPPEMLLDGNDWTVADFDPGLGVTQKAFADGYPATQAIAAMVPGDVHWDLERAGKLPPLFYGENSTAEKIGWVWRKEWWYRKSFRVPEAWQSREVRLHFDGVDYECEVWLNGQRLGRHEGAFTPFEFEVSKQLRLGEDNIVTLLVHQVPASLAGADSPPPEFRPAYSHTKGESELGWDFAPKIMNLGIEKSVKLISDRGAFLFQPLVFSKLSPPYDKAELLTKVEVQADHPQTLELRYQVRPLVGGAAMLTATQRVEAGTSPRQIDCSLELLKPELWWPHGYGEQPLYALEITARIPGSTNELHRVSTQFGVRDLKMLPNPAVAEDTNYFDYDAGLARPMPDPMPDRRYLMQINGRKIFARGGNWVPADSLYGRPDRSFYEHLVRSAAEANFNFIRLWGGGVLEKPDFYELCDRYGILLDQEFFCGGARFNAPETDEALAIAAKETRELLPLWINHPSIVRYCGGNEMYLDQDNSRQMAQLRAICNEVDPTRPFFDPDPIITAQRHGEYEFLYPRNYFMFNQGQYRFSGPLNPCEWTEYGVGCLSSVATLNSIIPANALWPMGRNNSVWRYHKAFGAAVTDDNWAGMSGCESLFGNNLPDLDTTVRCSQYTQAEALRCACSAMRRFRWHRSACAIWSYNEPWPNAAQGCIVEYSGQRKMAYYYMKQAFAPVDVMAVYNTLEAENAGTWGAGLKLWGHDGKFPVELWAVNDHQNALTGYRCRYRVFDLQGKTWLDKTISAEAPAEGSLKLGGIDWTPPYDLTGNMALLWVELLDDSGQVVARNFYPFGISLPGATLPGPLAGLLKAPATKFAAKVSGLSTGTDRARDFSLEIKNTGAAPALMVTIDEPPASESLNNSYPAGRNYSGFEDNYFFIPPGETRMVKVSLPATAPGTIRIKAWNSNPVEITVYK